MSRNPLLGLATVACLAPAALAQTTFGTGCTGFTGVEPTISLSPLPVLQGVPFTIDITGVPATASILVVGVSNSIDLGTGLPLPLDLGALVAGLPGCFLNVSNDLNFTVVHDPVSGIASLSTSGWDAGLTLYLQAWNLDADAVGFTNLGGWSVGYEYTSMLPGSSANPGDIVINEIMQNPDSVSDTFGEYFEIYNSTGADIDIEGWTISDNDFDSHFIDNAGAGVVVPAGGYAVLGANADMTVNGGIALDYDYDDYFLSNSADEIVVSDGVGTEIDRVEYDGGPGSGGVFPDPTGASMSLLVSAQDATSNDVGTNWIAESVCYIGGTPFNLDFGTPGIANDTCNTGQPPSASGELVITEVMQNPSAVSDNVGEWFELHNPSTTTAVVLDGYTISISGNTDVITSLTIPAGGYHVFAEVSDPLINGGITGAYDYDDAIFLSNGGATISILDLTGSPAAQITYDDGSTFPDPNGASMTFNGSMTPNQTDSEDGANWCEATSAYGLGDLGTPGAANDTCP